MGSRMHKAIEFFLTTWPRSSEADSMKFFQEGLKYGDSPLRRLPRQIVQQMEYGFKTINDHIRRTCKRVIEVEHRYHYVGNGGQVEGTIDAVVENKKGAVVLKEWKTAPNIQSEKLRRFTLQASAGLLGSNYGKLIDHVELVPVFSPEKLVRLDAQELRDNAPEQLENIFKAIRNRTYEPRKGAHCKECPLKRHCPAWVKS